MQAIIFLGDRQLELREFPDPTPGPGEVVVEMKASGMCGSDLIGYRAPKENMTNPVIAGHEPCGVVAAVGPYVTEAQAKPGMRVMVHHFIGCGVCNHCRTGWPQLCRQFAAYGRMGHGGHARFMKVPAITLVPLPDELSYEVGAAVACGTGTAWYSLERMMLSGRDTIAIFGQGPVGLSATQLAKAMGARVIAVDVNPDRLALAKEMGADVTISSAEQDPVQAVRELTHGDGADRAMDCSGNADARAAAVRCTRTWGTVGFVGEGGKLSLDVSPDLLRRQLTLTASWCFSTAGQAQCARFVADRHIPVEKVFTHRYSLDQAEEAYKLFDTQTTGKGVFLF
jgi:2-desacetyl-2-hydroxyethyl bacteriochlorophyllide A dehydrogenase